MHVALQIEVATIRKRIVPVELSIPLEDLRTSSASSGLFCWVRRNLEDTNRQHSIWTHRSPTPLIHIQCHQNPHSLSLRRSSSSKFGYNGENRYPGNLCSVFTKKSHRWERDADSERGWPWGNEDIWVTVIIREWRYFLPTTDSQRFGENVQLKAGITGFLTHSQKLEFPLPSAHLYRPPLRGHR